MPIVKMTDGCPACEAQSDGTIGFYAEDNTDPNDRYHGFLLTPAAAMTAAMRLLRAVQKAAPDHQLTFPISSVAMDQGRAAHEDIFRLTFEVDGALIPLDLNPTQLAELTAALAQVSRDADRSPML